MNIFSTKLTSKRTIFFLVGIATLSLIFFVNNTGESKEIDLTRYEELGELSEVKKIGEWGGKKYADYFEGIAEKKGGEYAFRLLRHADLREGLDLHLLAHTIGDTLYIQKGIDAVHTCTPEFRNACAHSIVIGLFNEQGEEALDEISEVCRNAPGGTGAYTMCFHGLGHGVLAYNNYNFEKTVGMCKKMATEEYNNREYAECVGGGVMELIAGVHDRVQWEKQVSNYFIEGDPLSPCNAPYMDTKVQQICYTYLTPHLFKYVGMSLGKPLPPYYEKAFKICNQIPITEERNRSACYSGFGKEFVALARDRDIRQINNLNKEELSKIHEWCSLSGDKDGKVYCTFGALSSLFWGGENDPSPSFSFCEIAEEELSDLCYEQLSWNIGFYIYNEQLHKSLCSKIPSQHQQSCLSRAPNVR